jgi:hypothetical protein
MRSMGLAKHDRLLPLEKRDDHGGVHRGPRKLSHMLSGFLPLADLG